MTVEFRGTGLRQSAWRPRWLDMRSLSAVAPRLSAVAPRLRSLPWSEILLLAVAGATVLLIRRHLAGFESGDYRIYLNPWYAFLQQHGFTGLGQEFADYNVPYLYLLFIGTLTPLSGVEWVKLLGLLADLSLAAGAYSLLGALHASRFARAVTAALTLLLPEVILNSSFLGQADSLYTALIVWGLAMLVRRRFTTAWIMLALALSFKLQAVFVVPVFLFAFVVQRHRVPSVLAAAAAFFATYLPALIAGRSLASLLGIYLKQAGEYRELVFGSPTLYIWLPTWAYDWFRNSGIYFAIGVTALLLAALRRRYRSDALSGPDLLQIATLFALLAPFLLPAMHERYFFTGDVLLFLLAIVKRRYLIAALGAQFIALQSYSPAAFATSPAISMPVLALVELGIICALLTPFVFTRSPVRGFSRPRPSSSKRAITNQPAVH